MNREAAQRPRLAYLGLGANIGRRARALSDALVLLDGTRGLALVRLSSVFETEPVGVTDQPAFLNLVACFDCQVSAAKLLTAVRRVERQLGRVRTRRWGPRTIDVDILLIDDERVDAPELTVPHPEMTRRQFVLVPLAEIAPEVVLPGGRTAAELSAGEGPAVRRLGTLAEVVARESADAGSDG